MIFASRLSRTWPSGSVIDISTPFERRMITGALGLNGTFDGGIMSSGPAPAFG
jgi:hypothetical protein